MSKDSFNTSKSQSEIISATDVSKNSTMKSWGPIAATVWAILIYIIPQIVVGFILSIYPALHHYTSQQSNNWLTNSIPAQFIFTLLVESISVVIVWLLLRYYRSKPTSIGIKKPIFLDILYAVLGFTVYFIGYAIILSVLQKLIPSLNENQQQDIGFQNVTSGFSIVLAFISLVILPPIAEEIIFRGFVFTGFRRKFGFMIAALGTSILFALPHLLESANGGLLWIAGIDTLFLSLVLCFLREKTDRLWAGMGVHALKNGFAFASLFIFHLH